MPKRLVRLENEPRIDHVDRIIDEIVASEIHINGCDCSILDSSGKCKSCRYHDPLSARDQPQCGVGEIGRIAKTLQNNRIKTMKNQKKELELNSR